MRREQEAWVRALEGLRQRRISDLDAWIFRILRLDQYERYKAGPWDVAKGDNWVYPWIFRKITDQEVR